MDHFLLGVVFCGFSFSPRSSRCELSTVNCKPVPDDRLILKQSAYIFNSMTDQRPPSDVPEKHEYQLEFSDDFDQGTLDSSKWLPVYLPQWSSTELSRPQYRFQESSLFLQITKDQKPWNPEFNGDIRVSNLQTGCFSGPLGSKEGQHRFAKGLTVKEAQSPVQLYTPQYGFLEVRMKAVPIPGYLAALWMIGFESHPEQSAEICICEIFGTGMTENTAEVGYGVHPFSDPHITDEFYVDTLPINAAEFHTYAIDWTPTHIDFFVDGVKIRTIHQSPNYPMQFMLNLYELPHQINEQSRADLWPKEMEVDFVRGWRKTQ